MTYNKQRGYHLHIPQSKAKTGLPSSAIQCKQLASGAVACSTEGLIGLNQRLGDTTEKIYQITDDIVVRLRAHLRNHVAFLC